jgi:hypothetical protein
LKSTEAKIMRINFLVLFRMLAISWHPTDLFAGEVRAAGQTEWDKTVDAAKKEGKLVAGIPASAELWRITARRPSITTGPRRPRSLRRS